MYAVMFSNNNITPSVDFVDVVDEYQWDFSSGINLAQNLRDDSREILSMSVFVSKIDSVTGKTGGLPPQISCDSDCSESWAYSADAYPYFDYKVFSLVIFQDTLNEVYQTIVGLNDSRRQGEIRYSSSSLPLENLSNSLADEVEGISGLSEINESMQNALLYNITDPGDIQINIWQSYRDGTMFFISIIGDHIVIEKSKFSGYYGSMNEYQFKDVVLQSIFSGTISEFFPTYTSSINEFLSYIIEV